MTASGYTAGIDLGATNTRVIVADADGNERAFAREETPRAVPGPAVTAHVESVLRATCRDVGIQTADITAVGIGSIGPLDAEAGVVVEPPNLPAVDRIDLAGPIGSLTGAARVVLHNDAVAGVIGERDAAPGNPADMVYLTISTGIGAGVVVDGRVLTGRHGNVGEVGHFVVDPHGARTCGCGGDGHWEAYASGRMIPEYARDLASDIESETILPLDDNLTAADIFEHPSDPLAAHTVDRVAEWNAIGVAAVVNAYAPELVVVGGGVAVNNPAAVVEPIAERLPALVPVEAPSIRVSRLGRRSVVHGALVSAARDRSIERQA